MHEHLRRFQDAALQAWPASAGSAPTESLVAWSEMQRCWVHATPHWLLELHVAWSMAQHAHRSFSILLGHAKPFAGRLGPLRTMLARRFPGGWGDMHVDNDEGRLRPDVLQLIARDLHGTDLLRDIDLQAASIVDPLVHDANEDRRQPVRPAPPRQQQPSSEWEEDFTTPVAAAAAAPFCFDGGRWDRAVGSPPHCSRGNSQDSSHQGGGGRSDDWEEGHAYEDRAIGGGGESKKRRSWEVDGDDATAVLGHMRAMPFGDKKPTVADLAKFASSKRRVFCVAESLGITHSVKQLKLQQGRRGGGQYPQRCIQSERSPRRGVE